MIIDLLTGKPVYPKSVSRAYSLHRSTVKSDAVLTLHVWDPLTEKAGQSAQFIARHLCDTNSKYKHIALEDRSAYISCRADAQARDADGMIYLLSATAILRQVDGIYLLNKPVIEQIKDKFSTERAGMVLITDYTNVLDDPLDPTKWRAPSRLIQLNRAIASLESAINNRLLVRLANEQYLEAHLVTLAEKALEQQNVKAFTSTRVSLR